MGQRGVASVFYRHDDPTMPSEARRAVSQGMIVSLAHDLFQPVVLCCLRHIKHGEQRRGVPVKMSRKYSVLITLVSFESGVFPHARLHIEPHQAVNELK